MGPVRQRVVFALLYFSEGAPIGFLWVFLATWLKDRGVADERIGDFVAILALFWTFKFFWAPALDLLRSPRWGYRAWLLTAQAAMGLTLLPLAWLDLERDFGLVQALCFLHAFFAATQDVSIDALAVGSVPRAGLGAVNGWMQAGMRLGMLLLGGVALTVVGRIGFRAVVLGLWATIWLAGIVAVALGLPDGKPGPRAPERPFRGFARSLRRVVASRAMLFGLLFALVGGAVFEGFGVLYGPFLLDEGFLREEIGVLATVKAGFLTAGALIGGRWADALGHRRAVVAFQLALAGAVVLVSGVAASSGPRNPWILGCACLAFFGIGLFLAATYAVFMSVTDHDVAGTQFSAFMSMTNGCEAWAVFATGRLAGAAGYPLAFSVLAVASLTALPCVARIRTDGGDPS